jgi:glycogen(starch) synthase
VTQSSRHVAMALYGDPSYDSRVQREAASLVDAGYRVTLACLEVSHPEALAISDRVEILAHRPAASAVVPGTRSPFHPDDPGTHRSGPRGRISWLRGYAANLRAWGAWARSTVRPDVWHAHDLTALAALGTGVRRSTRLVYDSHELYLESGTAMRLPRPARWLLARWEGRLIGRCDAVVTVNDGVAAELRRRYGVVPTVVLNCPPFREVPRPGIMRDDLGLGDGAVLLYHGALSPGRGLERTIDALRQLPPDVRLVILGDGSLRDALEDRGRALGILDRLRFHASVAPAELLDWVVDADLAIVLIEGTELNFTLSTPNKLFEAMTAGVPVVASDLPMIAAIVDAERIGAVVHGTGPDDLAAAVRSLVADPEARAAMGGRARAAARRTYNWEAQAERLRAVYDRLWSEGSAGI